MVMWPQPGQDGASPIMPDNWLSKASVGFSAFSFFPGWSACLGASGWVCRKSIGLVMPTNLLHDIVGMVLSYKVYL